MYTLLVSFGYVLAAELGMILVLGIFIGIDLLYEYIKSSTIIRDIKSIRMPGARELLEPDPSAPIRNKEI